jgi:hypothetical protein
MYEAATGRRSGIVVGRVFLGRSVRPAHLTYAYGEIADAAAEC